MVKKVVIDNNNYHALIKLSRFTFEYIVGTKTHVDFNIGQKDLIFMEKIEQINPLYLEKIHKTMSSFIVADRKNKNGIKFNGHNFTYKKSQMITIDEIIRVYRKAQQ